MERDKVKDKKKIRMTRLSDDLFEYVAEVDEDEIEQQPDTVPVTSSYLTLSCFVFVSSPVGSNVKRSPTRYDNFGCVLNVVNRCIMSL
jgi:hypothetical protein